MADISQIKLPDGTTYNLKDSYARTNYVLKAGDSMIGNLTAPKFIGALQGNADTATNVAWTGITNKPDVATEQEIASYTEANGSIATFSDGSPLPMRSLKAHIEPVQDLHGYDAPWVGGSGKNKANPDLLLNGYTNPSNRKYDNTTMAKTQFVKTEGLSTITISATNGNRCYVCYYNDIPNVGDEASTDVTQVATSLPQTITVDSSYTYVAIQVCYNPSGANVSNVQVESGNQATTFAPYSNICPISGWDECKVNVSGVNVWDEEWELGYYRVSDGAKVSDGSYIRCKNYIPIKNVEYSYNIISDTYSDIGVLLFYDINDNYIANTILPKLQGKHQTFTPPNNAVKMKFYTRYQDSSGLTYNNDISINYPSTDTSYHAYNGHTYTIDLDGTRYGGTLDVVSGVLTVDRVEKPMPANWSINAESSIYWLITHTTSDAISVENTDTSIRVISDGFKGVTANDILTQMTTTPNYVNCIAIISSKRLFLKVTKADYPTLNDLYSMIQTNNLRLVYELATPLTIQLTPTQVFTLLGLNNVWADTGDVDVRYQPQNVIAELRAEIQQAEEKTPLVYGFHIDGAESDPSEKVTYLADAVGMTPAHMNYIKDTFYYGSWKDVWFVRDCKPCILGQDGVVRKYLDPNDYSKDIDGNTVTIDSTLTGANVMIEFPKIWYKVVPDRDDDSSGSIYISPVKVDADYKDYAYIDYQGNHKEHFYMPAYNGTNISSVLRSVSDAQVMKTQTRQTEITYATANGDGWYTEDAGEVMLINFLLILMGKSTDTQTVFGQGLSTDGSESLNDGFRTGVHNQKGLFYGTNNGKESSTTYTNAVKVFGIENWWGFQWRAYAGDVLDNGKRLIKLCHSTEDGSSTFGFNIDGAGYINVGKTPSGTRGGYISKMVFTHDGMYSSVSSGSSTTHYCDGQWFDNSYHTIYAVRGGCSWDGSRVGALYVDLHRTPGLVAWIIGTAPSYK